MNPQYDSVLRYLMKRGFTTCGYDEQSDLLLVADRNGRFAEWRDDHEQQYHREKVLPPGIALYRRSPGPPDGDPR